jgi:hypothetical protein
MVEVILKEKKKEKKKKKWIDGENCYWYYKLSMFIIPPKILIKGFVYTWYIQIEEAAEWSDWFTYLIYSSLSWFIFAPLVSMAFELHPNIFHLDPKPCYNPWKVLMIHVMHVTPVVENEKICKPMVDHFHWNEFGQNTYPSNTWELSVYFREGLHF